MEEKTEKRELNIEPLVDLLVKVAKDKNYSPIDLLSRVEDNDEFYMRMAREALYEAIRFASVDNEKYPGLDEAVRQVLALIEKRPYVAKEIALKALARALAV
jgi:hypothetical protein